MKNNLENTISDIHQAPQFLETAVSTRFYVFGGMKSTQRTKLHVADINGITLCGVKSFWMECFEEIFKSGFIKGEGHLEPIQNLECTCKRCLKQFRKLNEC